MTRPNRQQRLIPHGLRCAQCGRPFRGDLAPTDYARRTEAGYAHVHGCAPMSRAETNRLNSANVQLAALLKRDDRLEDLEWMAQAGETLAGAAHRLGITPTSLRTWLTQNRRHDLYRQLLNRDRNQPIND